MDKLPKPLVALINSIIDEYECFTWNSIYLGDKMRVSLIWTKGDSERLNKGVKHKSKSSKNRDSKRLKIWQEKHEAINLILSERTEEEVEDIRSDISDIEIESVEESDNIEIRTPTVTSLQVACLPVVNKPVFQSIATGHKQSSNVNTKINIERNTGFTTTTKLNDTQVSNDVNKSANEDNIKTVAPKSIITGRSPCTDSHYEKVVFGRTSKGDFIIGKVKMREIVVTRNMTNDENLKHIDKESNKYQYEDLMSYQRKFKDIRKTDNDEFKIYANEIPEMDRYAEKFLLCPWCFKQ